MEKSKHKRFEVVHKQGTMTQFVVIVDKETGVNYLQIANGYAGGLTPLLDKNGNVVVTPVIKEF